MIAASSGHGGAEVGLEGNGRAGNQGLSDRAEGSGADAARSNTEERGRHDERDWCIIGFWIRERRSKSCDGIETVSRF